MTKRQPPPEGGQTNVDIGRWLRGQSDEDKRAWFLEHMPQHPYATYDIARRGGFLKAQAKELVEATVRSADASTIRWWLQFFADVAGLRSTLALFDEWKQRGEAQLVNLAGYWLGYLKQVQTPEGLRIVREHFGPDLKPH
jgi:hypothetical protein